MKLSVQKFLSNGYQKYRSALKEADFLLQKKIADEEGIRYYINIWVYVWENKPWYNKDIDPPIIFQPEVQFAKASNKPMNVTLIVDSITDIEEIEDTFNNLWESIGKPYIETKEGEF